MYYCQDCGGANAANATSCRICGHPLARERVGAPCQSCGAPTVAGANFCSLCGTATVAVPAASLAGVLPGSLKVDAAIVDERQAATARLGSTVNLSEGLDLPDWLKRAAAEQPFDPKHQTAVAANPFGPAGGAATTLTAPPPTNGSGASVTDLGSHPPLSIPLAGPAGASSQGSAPAADALVAQRPAAARSADVADTSTFISEDDLPEWIRQLAAADEAKKAEELRRAAEAALAEGQTAAPDDPRRRRPLPGETAPGGPATNPWLTRRERAETPPTVAADSWGAVPLQSAPVDGRTATQDSAPTAPTTLPSAPDLLLAERAAAASAKSPGRPNQLRVVLIAAVVLLVVALVAFMALS